MTGGLKTTVSRFAIAAAAAAIATSAQAADLGGNCCTDLEERVAELEATAARKGNRKVSLTVSGHVNETLVFWDDGDERNTYVVTNENSRTRFRFVGDAKISAEWSAGYLLEIGVRTANSAVVSQDVDDNTPSTASLDLRHSAWWMENKRLGRVWVGQTSSATDGITEINLSNGGLIGNNDINNWNGGFFLNTDEGRSGIRWGGISSQANANVGEGDRVKLVRYVSPTWNGFTYSSAWGEDDFWDVALRYANEFNGVRVAFGIGYQDWTDGNARFGSNVDRGCAIAPNGSDVDCHALGLSGSIMHVPTGLYVAGAYGYLKDNRRKEVFERVSTALTPGGFDDDGVKDRDEHWYVQAGIERNWFGIGKTTLYGEYFRGNTGAAILSGNAVVLSPADRLNDSGVEAIIGESNVDVWGLGIIQSIDAAAMDLYIGYRNYSGDVTLRDAAGDAVDHNPIKDFHAVMAGGIIRF